VKFVKKLLNHVCVALLIIISNIANFAININVSTAEINVKNVRIIFVIMNIYVICAVDALKKILV
jgi:hypothetical protein